MIKEAARLHGACLCGIGSLDIFEGENIQRDPKMILPNAKCIIGFGFPVPRALYDSMNRGVQTMQYTSMGVKYIDEEYMEIFLLRLGALIEDNGYDACLQRSVPGMLIKGDKRTNPEVLDTYELALAEPVEEGKPAPDVMIDFAKAAKTCGIGYEGKSGHILAPKYGPYIRYCFIVTDAPLELDEPLNAPICDDCGLCANACPGKAIDDNGLDTWQCAVYYKGAHKSNPLMNDEFLKDDENREAILNGDMRFDAESARKIYPELKKFLPEFKGYAPCLCGKKCDYVCYKHLKEVGRI
jgi:epoxyqueuosine reductase QueG